MTGDSGGEREALGGEREVNPAHSELSENPINSVLIDTFIAYDSRAYEIWFPGSSGITGDFGGKRKAQ